MPKVAASTAQWEFSTRTRGEVLIAETRASGVYLALLGVPEGFTQDEIGGWLHDVAGVAHETAAGDQSLKPIPALLHHALTGMLFSHAELWNRLDQPSPCSVVFVRAGDDVGFGWVGEAEVAVLIDEQPTEVHWVTVRDDQGREARAWSVEADRAVRARITWNQRPDEPGSAAARIEASWPGAAADLVPSDHVHSMTPPPEPPLPIHPETVDDEESPPDLHWGGDEATETPEAPEDSTPDRVEDARARAEPMPASLSGARMGSFGPTADLPPGFSKQIPPSPEPPPPGTTASDPRAISLPLEGPAPSPPIGPVRLAPAPAPIEPEWEAPEAPSEAETPASDPIDSPAPPFEPAVVVVRSEAATPAWAAALPATPAEEAPPEDADPESAEEPARRARRRSSLGPEWPSPAPPVPWWKNRWVWVGVAALALIGSGWLVGSQEPRAGSPARARAVPAWMRALGLGGPRFELTVRSRPTGAWISVDGSPPELRTPGILELRPGEHRIVLSLPSLGEAAYTVTGRKDEKSLLDAALNGSLEIFSPDPGALIAVAVDGEPQGFAPLSIDSLLPGAHEVRFSGPGMASWGQTIEIQVGQTKQILTRPLQSPATGLLVVRATGAEAGEPQPLEGARVWIDGAPRGYTPLQLELPRGPHSIRVARGDQEAPIQVIDLPGGNQRFADFELGVDLEFPRLSVSAPARIPADPPVVISAAVEGMAPSELREMWLHVRTPDGPWRRYAMNILKNPSGIAGAVVFPAALFGPDGKTPYYVSAMTAQGDEYFTEMRLAQADRPPRP